MTRRRETRGPAPAQSRRASQLAAGALDRIRRRAESGADPIYPAQLPGIMRKHIITGAMGATYFSLVTGIYLASFGTAIGMAYWQWGLLGWASSLTIASQLGSAWLVSRTGSRKWLWYVTAMASRLLRAAALATAFLLFGSVPAAARWMFIAILVVSDIFGSLATPPWFSWLACIIPREQHGRFMGRRSAWIALTNVTVVIPIGLLVDRLGVEQQLPVLMCVFAFALVVGVVDLLIHRTIPEPAMRLPPGSPFRHEVTLPLRDHKFRGWLLFHACWSFSMMFGASLANVHFVENLGIRKNMFGGSFVLIALPLLATVVGGRRLGVLVDRYGVRRTLRWGHGAWAVLPLFWILARPSTALYWLAASSVTAGLAVTLAANSATKLITRLPRAEHVAMYVAVSSCVGSLAGGAGPLLSGLALSLAREASWRIGGVTFIGFHLVFAVSLLARSLSTLLLAGVREPDGEDGPPGVT
jgi:MFS family permease